MSLTLQINNIACLSQARSFPVLVMLGVNTRVGLCLLSTIRLSGKDCMKNALAYLIGASLTVGGKVIERFSLSLTL